MRKNCLWAIAPVVALLSGLATQQTSQPAAADAVRPVTIPARLADTGLFAPGRVGEIDPSNQAFAPQYPLWSDGLTKRRWVYLPPGTVIDTSDGHDWQYPVGTRFWKEFSHGERKVETRLMWRSEDAGWVFATYVWNADGTDAVLAPADGAVSSVDVAPGKRHGVPSTTDCTACHGTRGAGPLGFNVLQLSPDRDPNAVHGEPLAPGMVTLETLRAEGRLSHAAQLGDAPRIRTDDPATRAALGYLMANCGACHDGRGDITATAPTIRVRDLIADGDGVAMSLIGRPTRWRIPGQPEGSSVLVQPGAPEASALLLRLRSRAPSSQMPPLGTVVRDQDAVDALTSWIVLELPRLASLHARK